MHARSEFQPHYDDARSHIFTVISRQSPCYIRFPFADLGGRQGRLRDLLSDTQYERDGNDRQSRGIYLDVPSWQLHVFEMKAA
jgi:hypothetical protein